MGTVEFGIESKAFFTSLGWSGVAVSDKGIVRIILPKKTRKEVEREFSEFRPLPGKSTEKRKCPEKAKLIDKLTVLLRKYFLAERVSFDVPLDIRYYTSFQQAVWRAALEIPYSETRSYAWIAKRIKRPRSARAVGQAMGANPVPIIIP